MPQFNYRVKDGGGNLIEGVKESDSIDHVATFLKSNGYFILDIEEKKSATGFTKSGNLAFDLAFWKNIKPRDVIIFTRQLATMLHAGVAFVDALSVIGEQTENQKLKAVIKEITQAVKEGSFFSKAIVKYPNIFSQLYTSMVEVGEAGGMLEDVLMRVVFIMENEEDTKSKIKSALTYPVIIVIIVFGVVGFLTTFVFPKFISIFQTSGVTLPMPTKILFNISNLGRKFWYVWMGLFIAATYLL
ncbi:MAG: type II secretion system F family protein, partial [Candidatus Omnitrophica bacterium]|nr:type II secretion system F family protein [Candidatus Omnitrophota bacterium]